MKTHIFFLTGLLAIGATLFSSCKDDDVSPDTRTVIIGTQEWMVENLNVDTFRNGDPIPEAQGQEWWQAGQDEQPAWCYFANDPANGDVYGKLYNFYAVIDPRGLAPEGWRVSTQDDWNTLLDYLGPEAGTKLKSTQLWEKSYSKGGNNSSGFSALPGSFRFPGSGFAVGETGLGRFGSYWSSTVSGGDYVSTGCYNYMWNISSGVERRGSEMGSGHSVRCLKGEPDFIDLRFGGQTWMFKNLDMDTFRNGDPIPQAMTDEEWITASAEGRPAWCYYQNDPENGRLYGKLYNWFAVNDPRKLAPAGWHLPSDAEWVVLSDWVGGDLLAGGAMKSVKGWSSPNQDATNFIGFTGLPGQYRNADGSFYDAQEVALFWSIDETGAQTAAARGLSVYNGILIYYSFNKGGGMSVRFLRD